MELAAIPAGTAKNRGIALGQAAAAMLASRANEDVLGAINAPYTPGTKPGDYQPTPPTNFTDSAGWGTLSTFGVRSSAQFRAPRPYSLQSLEYAMDVNEIAVLGKAGVSARTSDQTAIAFFWYENASFAWNRIARKLSGGMSLMQHARLYAALRGENAHVSHQGRGRVRMSVQVGLSGALYPRPHRGVRSSRGDVISALIEEVELPDAPRVSSCESRSALASRSYSSRLRCSSRWAAPALIRSRRSSSVFADAGEVMPRAIVTRRQSSAARTGSPPRGTSVLAVSCHVTAIATS